MKKLFALVLAGVMLTCILAGCGSKEETAAGTGSEVSSVSSAGSSTAQASTEEPAKEVTLKYLTWNYADRTKSTDAWIKTLKDKFNITIDMQNIPTDQYPAILKTHMASSDMPDLVQVHSISPDLVDSAEKITFKADTFLDLSDLSSVADYIPSVLDSVKAGGKLYYVPVSTNVLGVLYNKKVFTDNGISIPTDINAFLAVCDKLKAAKIIPVASGAKDNWTTQIINFIAFGQYIDGKDDTIRNKLADGSMKYTDIKDDISKVLSVQSDWAKKGYFQDRYMGTDINVACQMVGTGKAAMLINGTWQLKAIQDAGGDVGFFALPLNQPGEKLQVPTNANEGMCISAASANVEAARKAMDTYLSADNQALVMADLNGIATNTKVKPAVPFLQDVAKAMSDGNVQPVWWGCNGLYFPAATTFEIGVQMQNLLAGGTTIDKFIKEFDTANAKVLNK